MGSVQGPPSKAGGRVCGCRCHFHPSVVWRRLESIYVLGNPRPCNYRNGWFGEHKPVPLCAATLSPPRPVAFNRTNKQADESGRSCSGPELPNCNSEHAGSVCSLAGGHVSRPWRLISWLPAAPRESLVCAGPEPEVLPSLVFEERKGGA
jgi:hypothetical protein